jgi:multiple sugar transport system permease protein
MRPKSLFEKVILYTLLSAFGLAFAVPLAWTLLTSLKHPAYVLDARWLPYQRLDYIEEDGVRKPIRILEEVGETYRIRLVDTGEERQVPRSRIEKLKPYWANYRDTFTVLPFGRFFLNSLFVTGLITIGQLVTCSLAAYAFARLQFPGRDRVFLAYLGTLMVPGQLLTIPLYLLLREFGMIDTYGGIILPGLFSAYGTFLLRQFFMTIPRDLEDAARIDGAGHFHIYSRIILPLSAAALATLGTFIFIGTWNDFFWPFIVLNDNAKMTLTVGLAKFDSLYQTDWGRLMAGSWITLLPAVAVYILFQRYINRGIVLSGIKG